MAKLDDNQIIAMLAEMRDRPPPISPIKSPQKSHSDSEDEIPSSQPASTRLKAKASLRRASPTDDIQPSQPVAKRPKTEAGFSNLRNKIAYIEPRHSKTTKSITVLREHASKGTCPVGLQYRPRPHLRPDKDFQTCLHQICSRAEQDLLQLTIRLTDLKDTLATMFPDKNKRGQAERRIQQATSRSTLRGHKPKPAARHKQNTTDELALLKAKMNEVSTLFNVFSNNENKERVAIYSVVCFIDSTQANSKRSQTKNLKRSHMRKANKNQYAKQPRASNEKFIKNLSHKKLTDHETALLAKGLKFIPTPPVPASYKSLLRDFQVLTRYMCLQYIFGDSAGKPHPFNVKSNWQPLPQPSVALESYLERTKFEIASITFSKEKDNLSARQREAL